MTPVTVDYPYIYDYQNWRGLGDLLFPIITVRVMYRNRSLRMSALLDTGATYSVFDSDVARALDIDTGQLPLIPVAGLGGIQGARSLPHLRMKFGPMQNAIECRAVFIDGLKFHSRPNLIGRLDVFEHLQIGFDEAAKKIYMAANA